MAKNKRLTLGLLAVLLITLTSVIGGCVPAGETEGGETSIWTLVIFIVLILAMMYFVMIRPQRKRQKEHQEMVEELKRGDRVITAGGIYGEIESVSEDNVVLKVESGATIRIAKSSVVGKQIRESTF